MPTLPEIIRQHRLTEHSPFENRKPVADDRPALSNPVPLCNVLSHGRALMKHRNPNLFLLFAVVAFVFPILLFTSDRSVTSQSRERRVNSPDESKSSNENDAGKLPAFPAEVVKVDVDLVTIDALVLQKNTG